MPGWFLATGLPAEYVLKSVGWDPEPSRLFGYLIAVWLPNNLAKFQLPSASVDLGLRGF